MNDQSSWDECIETNAALAVTPNKFKAKSLIETAKGRINFLSEVTIKESNANYIFENYYSSVLELIHAIVLVNGYKVGNHICLGYYIRDILKKYDLFRFFDDCRVKRNALVYYGKTMEFEVANESIANCSKLIAQLNILLKNENRQN